MQGRETDDRSSAGLGSVLQWHEPITVCAIFIATVGLQWNSPNSVAVADGIAYITGGINLVRTGSYTNPFGEAETWFPPLYPLFIGTLSFMGRFDPVVVSRLISVGFAIVTLLLMWRIFRPTDQASQHIALFAGLILALNPLFQYCSNATLSQSTATALAFAAFTVWLKLPEDRGTGQYLTLGLLVAISYLARPEALILLPLLGAFDLLRRSSRELWGKYVVASLGCALLTVPYVIWLSVQTGELTFSNKSEVNLIAGRSEYWHSPREIIDPTTLEMGFYRHEVTAADELRRYIYNWRLVGSGYSEIYHLPLGGALVLSMLVGTIVLLRQQKWRLLWGLACQGGYVSVLAIYAVIPWYLHATLPALSVLAAYGLRAVFYKFCSQQCHVTWRIAAALLLIGVTIALIEGGTRHPRWTLTSAPPTVSLLKEAGERLESMEPSGGVVYEVGATIGYYGGRIRRRLTPNDLDTILRYIDTHEAGWPVVWLALSSLQVDAYHPSVRRLLEVDVPHLQRVFQYEDRRGKVVILRVH